MLYSAFTALINVASFELIAQIVMAIAEDSSNWLWPLEYVVEMELVRWWWPLAVIAAIKLFATDVQKLVVWFKYDTAGHFDVWDAVSLAWAISIVYTYIVVLKYHAESRAVANTLAKFPDDFNDLNGLRKHWRACLEGCGLVGFFAVIRLFKYVRISASMNILWRTLQFAIVDMMTFSVTLFVLVFAFGFLSMWVYGYRLVAYHNITTSLMTWWLTAVGEGSYDHGTMLDAYSLSGAVFLLFVLFVCIFAMNVFIAILSEAYETAKEEDSKWCSQREKIRASALTLRALYNEPIPPVTSLFVLLWTLFFSGNLKVGLHHGYKSVGSDGEAVLNNEYSDKKSVDVVPGTVHELKGRKQVVDRSTTETKTQRGHEVWIRIEKREVAESKYAQKTHAKEPFLDDGQCFKNNPSLRTRLYLTVPTSSQGLFMCTKMHYLSQWLSARRDVESEELHGHKLFK